jgi:hypothetical protein
MPTLILWTHSDTHCTPYSAFQTYKKKSSAKENNLHSLFQLKGNSVRNVMRFGHLHVKAGLVLHQGYVPENVTQNEHKIPIKTLYFQGDRGLMSSYIVTKPLADIQTRKVYKGKVSRNRPDGPQRGYRYTSTLS